MSLYGYLLMCPKCKEIAEFEGKTLGEGEDCMLYNCCRCIPQVDKENMVEAHEN